MLSVSRSLPRCDTPGSTSYVTGPSSVKDSPGAASSRDLKGIVRFLHNTVQSSQFHLRNRSALVVNC